MPMVWLVPVCPLTPSWDNWTKFLYNQTRQVNPRPLMRQQLPHLKSWWFKLQTRKEKRKLEGTKRLKIRRETLIQMSLLLFHPMSGEIKIRSAKSLEIFARVKITIPMIAIKPFSLYMWNIVLFLSLLRILSLMILPLGKIVPHLPWIS